MGGSASAPSAKVMLSQESFQPWLTQAPVRHALVLDEAVAVAVAVVLDPVQRPVGAPAAARSTRLAVQPPAAQLSEEHDEQRRRVDRAVVDGPAARRHPSPPAPPRTSWRIRPAAPRCAGRPPALVRRQRLQGAEGEAGVEGSAIHEVRIESRPKRVMNHGAPAATTGRSGCRGSTMRSAPRSVSLVWIVAESPGSRDVTTVRCRRQRSSRSTAALSSRSGGLLPSSPSSSGCTSSWTCQTSRGGSTTSKVRTPPELDAGRGIRRHRHPEVPAHPPVVHPEPVGVRQGGRGVRRGAGPGSP